MLDLRFFGEVNAVIVELLMMNDIEAETRLQAMKTLNLIIALNGNLAEAVLKGIDLSRFLMCNVYRQDMASIDDALLFLQNFTWSQEFCKCISVTILEDLKKSTRNMLSYSGFQAFIKILRWCTSLNKVEAFKNILRTMYFTFTLKAVHSLQFPEYVAMKTRLDH